MFDYVSLCLCVSLLVCLCRLPQVLERSPTPIVACAENGVHIDKTSASLMSYFSLLSVLSLLSEMSLLSHAGID